MMHRQWSRRTACQRLQGLMLVACAVIGAAATTHAQVLIDFEDIATGGLGGPVTPLTNQYAGLGVSFSNASAIDYSKGQSIPGHAHSGTIGAEACYASEFCSAPLEMRFSEPQRRVKVWVGYGNSLPEPLTVILQTYDAAGNFLFYSLATLGGPFTPQTISISTPLEVVLASPAISRATVGFALAALKPGVYVNNYLAIDDLEFDVGGPTPPTVIQVVEPRGSFVAPVPDAEVFADGASIGYTDPFGNLIVFPTMAAGTKLVAKKLVWENPSTKQNHAAGGSFNWNYRAYITSLTIDNDGKALVHTIPSGPGLNAPQVLTLSPSNTLIGVHLVASMEWDAVESEMVKQQARIDQFSRYLYNATDGQVLVEQVELHDLMDLWADADLQLKVGYGWWANANPGGLFGGSGPRISANRLTNAKGYGHEFGHYGFKMLDEYMLANEEFPNANGFCTSALLSPVFSDYYPVQPKSSCLMYLPDWAWKLCSAHPANPHYPLTKQGVVSCWDTLVSTLADPTGDERWVFQTPTTRNAIPGTINPPKSGTDLYPVIPVAAWNAKVTRVNDGFANLCDPFILNIMWPVPVPAGGLSIWHDRKGDGYAEWEGWTDAQGKLLIAGYHAGDYLRAHLDLPGKGPIVSTVIYLGCPTTSAAGTDSGQAVTASQLPEVVSTVQIASFHVMIGVDLTSMPGQLSIRVRAVSGAGSKPAPLVDVPKARLLISGHETAYPVVLQFEPASESFIGFIGGLPRVFEAIVEVAATSPGGETVVRHESVSCSQPHLDAAGEAHSADGVLTVVLPDGALPDSADLLIGPADVLPAPLPAGYALVGNAFRITSSPGSGLVAPAGLVLHPTVGPLGESLFDLQEPLAFRYNEVKKEWEQIPGLNGWPAPLNMIVGAANELGVFAVASRVSGPTGPGPDCSAAEASQAQLWPPNHQMVAVSVTGVSASDGGSVAIQVDAVTSDEATKSRELGDKWPDAIIDGASVNLRAERSGNGNGRVYTIYFTATDSSGTPSSWRVYVCVPHDLSPGSECIDDQSKFDATKP